MKINSNEIYQNHKKTGSFTKCIHFVRLSHFQLCRTLIRESLYIFNEELSYSQIRFTGVEKQQHESVRVKNFALNCLRSKSFLKMSSLKICLR